MRKNKRREVYGEAKGIQRKVTEAKWNNAANHQGKGVSIQGTPEDKG